jgi:uncharacterized protein YjcR
VDRQTIDTSLTSPNKPDKRPKKIDHAKTIELAGKGMSHSDIAKYQGCDPSNITRVLQRYGVSKTDAEEYLAAEKLLIASLASRVYKNITDDRITKMTDKNLNALFGITADKLHQSRSGNHGVAIQINIAKPDGEVEIKEVKDV